jgi:hypothetical protein
MADQQHEPDRVLGIPLRSDTRTMQGEEPQRVMGFPVDWFADIDLDWVRSLAHPVRGYRRWLRRRHLDPYLMDEDQPGPGR